MGGEEPLSFEKCLGRLEMVVREIESGNIDLDTAMVRFTEGMELVGKCRTLLSGAEQKLCLLLEDVNGKLLLTPTKL